MNNPVKTLCLLLIRRVLLFFTFIVLNSATGAFAKSDTSGSKEVREYVMITLKHDSWPLSLSGQREITKTLQDEALRGPLSEGFELVHRYATVPALAGWIDPQTQEKVSLQAKQSASVIRRIDADASGSAWPLSNSTGGGGLTTSVPKIGVDKLHELGVKGNGMEIAVLDTGIDRDHPDLSDSYIAEQCFCFNPSGNCCPNGQFSQSGGGSAEDDNGHGTNVAGILASRGNNGPVGVAPRAKLTVMKIVDRNNSFFSTSDIVAALDWLNVNRPNVDVVSMSLFTNATFNSTCDQAESFTQALFTAVQNLVAKNVLVVAIAGNSSGVGFLPAPGCLSNVVAVGAVDTNDTPAGFSNSHPNVEYFAPGVSILTPALGGAYALATGTSFACPHVSAAAALMKQAGGGATNQAIRQQLSPGES